MEHEDIRGERDKEREKKSQQIAYYIRKKVFTKLKNKNKI